MRARSLALLLPTLLLAAPLAAQSKEGTRSHSLRLDKGEGYVVVDGDSTSSFGEGDELRFARRAGERAFGFRKEGHAYLVKDVALVQAAKAAVEPMGRLGAAQGKLGAEQGRLGAQQGKLGAEQGRLGARMAGASSAEMEALGAQMRELAKKQEALGREQEALGAKQRELGRQQEAAADAAVLKLRALRDEALAKGLAQAL